MPDLRRRSTIAPLVTAPGALLAACGRLAVAADVPATPRSLPTGTAGAGTGIAELAPLADQAASLARVAAPDALLRQIDVDWGSQEHVFRFTSAAASTSARAKGEVAVIVPRPWAPAAGRTVMPPWQSPLVTSARTTVALGLAAMKVGPYTVAQALLRRPAASVRILSLLGSGTTLTWYTFGTVSGGDVSVTVSKAAGAVSVPDHCSARPPSVATPRP